MPTLRQLKEWVDYQIREGKEALHTNHVVIMEEEAEKKSQNKPDETGHRKTKIAWDCKDPETFAELHKEREKYMRAAGGNPILGTDAMIMALRLHDFEEVRTFVMAIAAEAENE